MNTLENYRKQIDLIDEKLIDCISERIELCKKIALHKKENNIPMMQPGRVQDVIKNICLIADSKELNTEFIKHIYSILHKEIFEIENLIIDN